MLILLEGNECNFKSTVAEKLSSLTGYRIVKGSTFEMSKAPNSALFDKFKSMTLLDNTVIDRFIYSNLVYASLYKDYSIIGHDQKLKIESELLKKNAIVVYLYADPKVIKKRIRERGDEYVHEDMIEIINNKYMEVLSKSTLPIIHINTEFLTSDNIVKYIQKLLIT